MYRGLNKLLVGIGLSLFVHIGFAQCPVVGFSNPDTICLNQPITLANTTTGATSYEWDFCTGEILNTPTGTDFGNINGDLAFPSKFDMVKENGKYYAFVANYTTDEIVRLDFGNDIDNTPTTTVLTLSPMGILNGPSGVQLVKDNGRWYALVVSTLASSVVRLDFKGSDIEEDTLLVTDLAVPGLNVPLSIALQEDNSDYFAFVTNFSSNSVTRLHFDDSITGSYTDFNTGAIPNVSQMNGITIGKHCDQWYGFTTNFINSKVIRISWVGSLATGMTFTDLGNFGSGRFAHPNTAVTNGRYSLFLSDHNQDQVRVLDFGNDPFLAPNDLGGVNPTGTFVSPRQVFAIQDSSILRVFVSDQGTNSFLRLEYDNSCGENMTESSSTNISTLTYSTPGTKYIQLIATDASGNSSFVMDSVYVQLPPTAGFSTSNMCFPGITSFTDASSGTAPLSNWNWDFGDLGSGVQQNDTHSYASTGIYNVSLIATDIYGCADTVQQSVEIFNTPVASFTNTTECAKTGTQFTDGSTVPVDVITQWEWDFATGDTAITQNPNYTFVSDSSYPVELIVTSNNGCTDTVINPVNVLAVPYPAFSVDSSCVGANTYFTDLSPFSGSITNWDWDFGDSNTSTLQNPQNNYGAGGNYNVELIVTGNNGCVDTVISSVTVAQPAATGFSYLPAMVCQNTAVIFTDTSVTSGDSISAWHWDFGNSDSSIMQSPVYTFPDTGDHNVTLTTTTGSSCRTNSSAVIYIVPSPDAGFSFVGSCESDSTFFTDTSSAAVGNVVTWNWNFGDSNSSNAQNPGHSYNDTLAYTVSLSITSDLGCSNTFTDTVKIYNNPMSGFISSPACENLNTVFTDTTSSSVDSIMTWIWDFGDTTFSNVQNPLHPYSTSGNYQVQLIVVTSAGCRDTMQASVTVNPSPDADFVHSTACAEDSITFTNTSTGVGVSWNWDFGDSNTSINENPNHAYSSSGNYSVQFTINNSLFCWDTITKDVQVSSIPLAFFPGSTGCAGTSMQFTDSSTVSGDSITAWNWNVFGEPDTNYNQNPILAFGQSGQYLVTLIATSSSGCKGTYSQLMQINPQPTANFVTNPLFGEIDSIVGFVNQSSNDTLWFWDFGDGDSSLLSDPQHTYLTNGDYSVALVVWNEFGCSDTMVREFSVAPAVLDVAVSQVAVDFDANFMEVSCALLNLGSRDVYNMDLVLDYPSGASLKESWSGSFAVGTTVNYTFNAKVEVGTGQLPEFVCVIAEDPNGLPDDMPSNNELCITLDNVFLVFDIYPSPTTKENITVAAIIPEMGALKMEVFDSRGKLIDEIIHSAQQGINKIPLQVQKLSGGTYFIKFSYGNQTTSKSFVKSSPLK